MKIKRSVDFIDWLIEKKLAKKTPNGVVMETLSTDQLNQLKYEYTNGSTAESLERRKTHYQRKK